LKKIVSFLYEWRDCTKKILGYPLGTLAHSRGDPPVDSLNERGGDVIRDVILGEIVIRLRILFALGSDELFEVFLEVAEEYLVVLGREKIRDPTVVRLKMAQQMQKHRVIVKTAAVYEYLSGMTECSIDYVGEELLTQVSQEEILRLKVRVERGAPDICAVNYVLHGDGV